MDETRTDLNKRHIAIIAAMIVATAGLLLAMGRTPWCECGYIKLWHGEIFSSENSQHLTDWYSPSHLVHGILSYALLHLVMGKVALGWRAITGLAIELAWELGENTDAMINRYRETTISLGYYGDSVINSLGDIGFMLAGFFLASRLPVWASAALALGIELVAAIAIRDNLTLNAIMLIYPSEAIKQWQLGG